MKSKFIYCQHKPGIFSSSQDRDRNPSESLLKKYLPIWTSEARRIAAISGKTPGICPLLCEVSATVWVGNPMVNVGVHECTTFAIRLRAVGYSSGTVMATSDQPAKRERLYYRLISRCIPALARPPAVRLPATIN